MILAVDPAYAKPIAWSLWQPGARAPEAWGLWDPWTGLPDLSQTPTALVYESDHFGRATYGLGMAVGQVIGLLALPRRQVRGITSTTWRRPLRFARADRAGLKAEAIRWVHENLGIATDSDDIAEALCLGWVASHWPWPWDVAGSTPATPARRRSPRRAARKQRHSGPPRSSRSKSGTKTGRRVRASG